VPPFFAGLVTRGPFVTEEAKAVPLLRTALSMRAIELDSKRLIWLYQVHENRDPVVPGSGLQRPYALFTTGDAPYAANAQFDLAYWDFANYALRVT
jgi:hypothetical protein